MSNFDSLTDHEKEKVMEIVANFHCRNGVKHNDGSIGEIRITLKEFNNVLAKLVLDNRRLNYR